MLRKKAHVESLVGLTVETCLLGPLALGYLLWLQARGQAAFLAGVPWDNVLLPLAGVLTATPLLWFTMAARRLRLTTIGFLQYITPTLHFLLAVFVYGYSDRSHAGCCIALHQDLNYLGDRNSCHWLSRSP